MSPNLFHGNSKDFRKPENLVVIEDVGFYAYPHLVYPAKERPAGGPLRIPCIAGVHNRIRRDGPHTGLTYVFYAAMSKVHRGVKNHNTVQPAGQASAFRSALTISGVQSHSFA